LARGAGDFDDGAVVIKDELLGDCEAQSHSTAIAAARFVSPVEAVEQCRKELRGDAWTGIGDADLKH